MCQRLLLGIGLVATASLASCQTQESATTNEWFRIKAESPADRSEINVSYAGDMNEDGVDDVIIRYDKDSDGYGTYVIYGKVTGFTHVNLDTLQPKEGFKIRVNSDSGYLTPDAGIGDVNGDGIADFVVAARNSEAYIIYGKSGVNDDVDININSLSFDNGFRIHGTNKTYEWAEMFSSAGDVNGDGLDDLIIAGGHRLLHGSGLQAYVIYGSSNRLSDINLDVLMPDVGFEIRGTEHSSKLESASGAGDVNGDGVDDLIIGFSYNHGYSGEYKMARSGRTYLIYGSSARLDDIDLSILAPVDGFVMEGRNLAPEEGWTSAMSGRSAGDVNGDGVDDFIVSEIGYGVYVVYGGGSRPGRVLLSRLPVDEGFIIYRRGYFDGSVSDAGDVNGDGLDDFIIKDESNVFVIFGKRHRSGKFFNAADMQPKDGFRIQGAGNWKYFASGVSASGDVNGDGIDDIIIDVDCFERDNTNNFIDNGVAYVILGRKEVPFGSSVTVGADPDYCPPQ
ncbi:MAG: hypothetical protein ACR2PR_01295 [Pseudohongiellaceae bacterium]